MTAVKGSKQYRVKVVQDRPLMRWLSVLVLTLLFAAGVFASFKVGFTEGMAGQERALSDVARLTSDLKQSQVRIEELEQQMANLKVASEVDQKASEDVRQEVISLKDQLAELQEENSFYRNLMAPTGNKRGLTFGAVELGDTDRLRTYRYKVVMQQLATSHELLTGNLRFTVIGKMNGFEAQYALSELSQQVDSENIKLRFKYFQTIEGQLSLPEGFEPERIELVANSTGRDSVTVEKRFGWLVEET